MPNNSEYALMAGLAYRSTRDVINRFPVPDNWEEIPQSHITQPSGFEAISFQNGNEIVISYAGTDPGDWFGDVAADIALALGLGSDQLREAAVYYLEVRAANPEAVITFTGHSLGGGLAALMGVFFDRPAVTFDQAPFAASAAVIDSGEGNLTGVHADLLNHLRGLGYADHLLRPLETYIGLTDRQHRVSGQYVVGEFLTEYPVISWPSGIGNQAPLEHGANDLSGIDLHSQSLLSAFVLNDGFREATNSLTDLGNLLFDSALYYHDPNDTENPQRNFLENLLRHEIGVDGSFEADKMLARFTADLQKLAATSGLSLLGSDLTKALIAFAMQAYYEGRIATDISQQLFEAIGGGLHFERSDISTDPDLNKIKGYVQYFKNYLATLPAAEQALINQQLPDLLDWYLAGTHLAATAGDQTAFMLGASKTDSLIGGSQSDLLVGLDGNDILAGRGGDDTLVGGQGLDTYLWNSGDGADTLVDSDKQGRILINGKSVKLLIKSGSDWKSPDGKITLTQGETWKLNIDGGSLDLGAEFTDGDYGIHRLESALGGAVILGDLKPLDTDPDQSGEQWDIDSLGNLLVTATPEPGRADHLFGSASADTLRGLEGDDILEGKGGNDLVEGGEGSDIVSGQDGNDTVWGNSSLTSANPVTDAYAAGETGSALGVKGDWIDGGAGDDLLLGNAARDLITGGLGNDILIGGADDDLLLGDQTIETGTTEWDLARSVAGNTYHWSLSQGTTTGNDSDGGADALYGGTGADWLYGGAGDDLLDGGNDDDVLFGEAGHDVLIGGAGNDMLNGDSGDLPEALQGNDWIDGGTGNDTIFGMAGDDVIIGGEGNDTLVGGKGRDTYIYNKGDGVDIIIDDDSGDEKSILVLGDGIDKDNIKLRKGSLLLDLGDGDAIHIENFNAENPLATQSFDSFQFADGSSLGWEELLARGFDLDGTEGDDYIEGTGLEDRIAGKGGNDILFGLDGNDTLIGGTGTDGMNGGLGDDTYVFEAGDGATSILQIEGQSVEVSEAIEDDGGDDTIRFGASVDPAHLRLQDNLDGSLVIDYNAAGQPLDRLLVRNGLHGAIERFEVVGAGESAQSLSFAQFVGTYAGSILSGTDDQGHAQITGGKVDDEITVADGETVVSGGQGNDLLAVYGDGNTILYSVGDGADTLVTGGTGNVLKFFGATAGDLKLSLAGDALVIQVGSSTNDTLRFLNFDPTNILEQRPFDRIEFDDGSSLTYAELIGTGLNLSGTDGDDVLTGSNLDDNISAGSGNDILTGGQGNDTLAGEGGADVYRFMSGSGTDTVIDGGAETNVLRFESWRTPGDLRTVQEGNDLRLIVRGTSDGVILKDYYSGEAQYWQVDFDGAYATELETIIAQPNESTSMINALWLDTKDQVINAQIWTAENIYTNYVGPLGGVIGWRNLGNLRFEVPWIANPRSSYSQQVTTTVYRDLNGVITSTQVNTDESEEVTYWGYGASTIARRSIYQYEVARIESDDSLIVNSNYSWNETVNGSAIATVVRESYNLNPQHSTWNTSGIVTDQYGTAIGTVQYFYDLTTYDRSGWVLSFDNDTSGWSAPANTVIGNQVAVDYQMTIQHQPLVTELVGGDGNNEIHAETSATEFVDGGAGNDTIFGGGGAMGRGDLLYGNSGDDTIYGNGSVMAGGDGNDVLIGGHERDRYLMLSVQETGSDLIVDHGTSENPYLDWYYSLQGIADYEEYSEYGVWELWSGEGPVFDSLEEVGNWLAENAPDLSIDDVLASGVLSYRQPLEKPMLGDSKDFRLIGTLGGAGILPQDVVDLPDGISRDDLSFGWGTHSDETGMVRATLDISWHGEVKLRVVMPRAGDSIGFGVEYIGGMTLSECIEAAPPMPDIGDGTLVGNGESNDLVASTDGSHLFGMDGDDELVGSTGDDTLNGGYGDDLMAGREGNDIYVFRRGDGFDTIYDHDNTQGNIDTVLFDETISPEDIEVFAEGGDLFLSINDGSGTLCLSRWADGSGFRVEQVKFMDGTTWDTATLAAMADIDLNVGEIIEGLASDEVLVGTPFDDEIYGNEGNDIIIGGEGDDFIDGGSGSNTYVFGPNDGHDMLEEMDGAPASIPTDINTIRFVDGIAPDDVTIERNEYGGIVLSVHDGASSVSFWAQPELMPTVEFHDGTTWGVDELIGNTVLDYDFFAEVIGSTGNDTLVATLPAPTTIHGLDGNDTLVASDSGSWLIGGSGDDTLIGNTGDDWYFMDAHSGQDVLIETADNGSWDGLDIGPDISPDQIRFVRYAGDNGNDLIVSVEGTDAELTISNWFDPVAPARLEGFYFWNDDTELFDDALEAAIWADNTAPIFSAVDPEARVGVAFSLDLNNLLSDPDEDRLVYEVTLADGSPLPGWLELDSATGILSGTPETADAGTLDIHLSGTDGGGLAASGTFSLNVVAVIDEPPTVTAESTTLLLDAVTPISDLISITGNVQSYQFWDDVNGGGHFVLNGIAQPSGTSITVAADQIDLLQYAAGSETGIERVWARVSDGNTWSTWTPWNITSAPHLTNEAPIANADNLTIGLGEAVAASGMFSVADADGDVPTKYEFWDDSASGGRFVLGGIDQSAGTSIAIASDQLADLKYVGDGAISTERVWVRAYDGQAWSAWKSWNITSAPHPTNEAPVISATDGTVGLNTLVAAGTLFTVEDADGDVATKYEFWDDGQGGGHFVLNGVDQVAGTSIAVNADQLADLQYVGADTMGSERVWARAWDGQAWSAWKSWNMLSSNHATNAAPEASAANATLLLGEAVAVSSLFSASDIDGDLIVKYEFWDDVNGGGHFSKGGIEQAAGVSIAVPADELSEVAYVAGSQTGSERVWVRASDGVAWGAWTPWNMTSAAHLTNAVPVITAPTGIAGLGQAVAASSLFSVVDPDGDVPSKYEFWDDTNGGGYFAKNGIAQASGTSISVTADELPDLTYVGGNAMTSERVWVRAYDGQAWSSWTAWNMQSSDHETNAAPTITTANRGVLSGDALAASSLFSATDIDGDAAVKFEFWDDVNGGYFAKAGVQQAAGTSIAVSATDLADLSYVGGTAAATERVWVRANDGLAWSGWTSWNMTTVTGLQRGSPGGDSLIANGEILLGNEGNDSLSGPTGNNLLFGGAGDDTLSSGPGSSFLAGGTGNDTLQTGAGNDVIAFNAGDGNDAIYLNGGADTISLGGGIRYQDLSLHQDSNDLVLDTGNGESLTFKDWYADISHQSALNLQLIAETMADFDANGSDALLDNKVEAFDFRMLVDRFEQARTANAAITQWNLMNDLMDAHLFGADDAALGGDLSYQYGRYGNFANVGLSGAQNVLNGSQFALGPQTFQSLQGLQEGVVRLG